MRRALAISTFMLFAAVTAAAWAAAGDVDHTFAGNGKLKIKFGTDGSGAFAIARSPLDDRLEVAGVAYGFSPYRFAVARLEGFTGSLDHSFSGDGKRTVSIAGGPTAATCCGVADWKGRTVVAGGVKVGGGGEMAEFRLTRSGQLDRSFSNDGKRLIDFGGATDVAVQHDGKVVVVGTVADHYPYSSVAIARLNEDGSIDHSFSSDGRRTLRFGSYGDLGRSVALQGNNDIVVAGTTNTAFTGSKLAVARLLPGGALDPLFSGDGKRTVTFPNTIRSSDQDVALEDNGAVVLAGRADFGNGDSDFAVARLDTAGAIDRSFSDDGRRLVSFGPAEDQANGDAIQFDKIVLAGQSDQATPHDDFAVARLKPNGGLDNSFSGDGRRTFPFTPYADNANGVALQVNGRIVAAGEVGHFGVLALKG
jgi:uncharacterized delta-60 repeat protein